MKRNNFGELEKIVADAVKKDIDVFTAVLRICNNVEQATNNEVMMWKGDWRFTSDVLKKYPRTKK